MMPDMEPGLIRDVVVVVPGIMGTELLDRDRSPVWSLQRQSLIEAIRTFGGSVRRLQLPDDIGDSPAPDGVIPGSLMPALHVVPGLWRPIAGYSGLLSFLTGPRLQLVPPNPSQPHLIPNLVPFGYDWRLSCRYNGRQLAKVAKAALARWRRQSGMGDARLILLCHSMGGLVARWFLECEGGAELTRAVVTIGTPHQGALRALDTLAGEVEPGFGRFRLRLTDFVHSLPSLHQLLPTYRCVVSGSTRITIAEAGIPGLNNAMVRDAASFHAAITPTSAPDYSLHKVVGIRQPTLTTARVEPGRIVADERIDGLEQGGDGTVPRLAAEPIFGRGTEIHEIAGQHGELQGTRSALDLIDGILSRQELIYESADSDLQIGVAIDDIHQAEQEVPIRVVGAGGRRVVAVALDGNDPVAPPVPVGSDGTANLPGLPPGAYRVRVTVSGRESATVTHPILVWPTGLAAARS